MLRLTKNTWHYRNWDLWLQESTSSKAYRYKYYKYEISYNNGARTLETPNLCTYSRVVFFWAPLRRFGQWYERNVDFTLPLSFVLAIAGIATLVLFTDEGITAWWHPYAVAFGIMFGLAFFLIGCTLVFSVAEEAYWKIRQRRRRSKSHEDLSEQEPNILLETLKAKKQKVCPLIEFVDEK